MRIGLISDTHGVLRPEVFPHFAGVDLILHAGDIGGPPILMDLRTIAPVHAVFGNTDPFDVRQLVGPRVELELEGWRVLVTHGHELGSPRGESLCREYPEAQVIVYGHTHVPRIEEIGPALIINPGAAGPARFRLKPSIALLELDPAVRQVREISL